MALVIRIALGVLLALIAYGLLRGLLKRLFNKPGQGGKQ